MRVLCAKPHQIFLTMLKRSANRKKEVEGRFYKNFRNLTVTTPHKSMKRRKYKRVPLCILPKASFVFFAVCVLSFRNALSPFCQPFTDRHADYLMTLGALLCYSGFRYNRRFSRAYANSRNTLQYFRTKQK